MEASHFIFLRMVLCYFVPFPTTLNSEIPSSQMLSAAAIQVINRETEICCLRSYEIIEFLHITAIFFSLIFPYST